MEETLPPTVDGTEGDSRTGDRGGASFPPGSKISRYDVTGTLGMGGMGVVYAAFDPELDRKVAIKLLRTRGESTQANSARARLLREAQAMAKLSDPHVVTVHDVGTVDQDVFIAMELVDGQTLGRASEGKDWRTIVNLYREAARGLKAAHDAGLVHRDFKPDNVMVGDDGRVRVMDFGLARAEMGSSPNSGGPINDAGPIDDLETRTDSRESLTRTGALVGTPAYMSPEQFDHAEVGPASDQFSFCVALYEALWGKRPFEATSLANLAFAVLEGAVTEPPRNSPVPPPIRDAVVRGLAVDPKDRHDSMDALIGALGYDPARRRRRWMTLALAASITGLAAWGGASFAGGDDICGAAAHALDEVWSVARRERVERAIKATELEYAPESARRVLEHIDRYASDWTQMRTDSCQATHERGEQSEAVLDLRVRCLDQRRAAIDALVTTVLANPEVGAEKGPDAAAALPGLERCSDVETLQSIVPLPDGSEASKHAAALDDARTRANALWLTGDAIEARTLIDEALAQATVTGFSHPPTLAQAELTRGRLLDELGDYEAAVLALDRAAELFSAGKDDAGLASTWATLAHVRGTRQAAHPEAVAKLDAAAQLSKRVGDPALEIEIATGRARLTEATGKYEESIADQDALQAMLEGGHGAPRALPSSLQSQGRALSRLGRFDEAHEKYQAALGERSSQVGPGHPDLALFINALGSNFESKGELDAALEHFERALEIWRASYGDDHPHVTVGMNNVANIARLKGEYANAAEQYRDVIARFESSLGPEHPNVAAGLRNLGSCLGQLGDHTGALEVYRRSLKIHENTLGPDHPEVAADRINIGTRHLELGNPDTAIAELEAAHASLLRSVGGNHPNVGAVLVNLANIAYEQGDYPLAIDHSKRALETWEPALGSEHPYLAYPLTSHGAALIELRRETEAVPILERAVALRSGPQGDIGERGQSEYELARALWRNRTMRARSRALMAAACEHFEAAGANGVDLLGQCRNWQDEHR